MNTHEVARILNQLAKALKAAPNIELDELPELLKGQGSRVDSESVAVNIQTLANLSRIDKGKWRDLVQEWELPIDIPPAYSARDTIGKVLQYLNEHPNALSDKLKKKANSKASPELMNALSILMGGNQK